MAPPHLNDAEEDWLLVVPSETARREAPRARPLAPNEETHQPHITGIFAHQLIPGKSAPLSSQAVISENGKIVYVGPRTSLPSKYSAIALREVPVLMPGMWECHSHFMGVPATEPLSSETLAMTNAAAAGARCARALKDTLYAGWTSCVDLGGYGPELQRVVEEGVILGPRVYGAGGAISMTGGHGDVFEIPLGSAWQKLSVHAPGTEVGTVPLLLADGVDECRKAVRINLRRGARVIKVMTSGGVASLSDDPQRQQFSDEELQTIVDEARRMGLVCAAHAIGKPGIMAAIRAGFKVIEHGSYADEEVFRAMKKRDVLLVATISPLRSIVDNEASYPPSTYAKARAVYETHIHAYKSAIESGVRIALGSDLFGGTGSDLAPGLNGREVVYAVEAGMSPLDAIAAATAHGPETLGPQAPKSGQIREGYDADFLGLEENPLDDIELLKCSKAIKWIWKAGRLVKAPDMDPWDALEV